MQEIAIITISANRPDFIKPQLESIKKHLKDDFYYVVVNNSYFGQDKPEEIEKVCKELNTGYVRVKHAQGKTEPSALVKDTLNFLWKDFKNFKGILAIVDSDLFFTEDVSFNELLEGYDMAFCPIYTDDKVWPWTGFMLFNMNNIHEDDISFSFACLDGKKYQDVGSAINGYIQKHNPKIRFIERREILDEYVESLDKAGFPHPYSVDILPFMFHYKTSSNYAKHCTSEYNELKTKALQKILTI